MTILDASAVLALLQDEPGAGAVEDAVDTGAVISSVNFAEVLAKMASAGAAPQRAATMIRGLFVEVETYDEDLALESATIYAEHPRAGLSLADRACLALARNRGLRVLTADRAWTGIAPQLGIEVRVIR